MVHSYGRLIPHEFPITDLQQISGPDGIGRITCTVSSGTLPKFHTPNGTLNTGDVTLALSPHSVALDLNISLHNNKDIYCDEHTNYFYVSLTPSNDSE